MMPIALLEAMKISFDMIIRGRLGMAFAHWDEIRLENSENDRVIPTQRRQQIPDYQQRPKWS